MRRVVNYKFVIVIFVAIAVLGTGIHFVHAFQVKRNAATLLEAADDAEKNGKDKEALKALEEYLGFYPHEADALARYGKLLLKQAKDHRGIIRGFLVLE